MSVAIWGTKDDRREKMARRIRRIVAYDFGYPNSEDGDEACLRLRRFHPSRPGHITDAIEAHALLVSEVRKTLAEFGNHNPNLSVLIELLYAYLDGDHNYVGRKWIPAAESRDSALLSASA